MSVDLRLSASRSLKDKRAVVRPIVEGVRRRFSVAVAEVSHQDLRQRAGIGMATVAGSSKQVEMLLDEVERFVWSRPEVEVLGTERSWVECE